MTTTDVARPRFARMYPKAAARAERRGGSFHRRQLLAGLTGRVVELGAGNGLNFGYYPDTVTEVIAIEPEPTLRGAAQEAAAGAPMAIDVRGGTADSLPVEDGSIDAAVVSLVLCSVPDQSRALDELRRVIKPGGELRFYEHVIANCQPKRTLLTIADRSGLWPKIAGGCHPARDTQSAIEAAGFTIETSERFNFAPGALEPSVPHILGIARRP